MYDNQACNEFEKWIKNQPFYTKLMFIHGERLFIRGHDGYKVFAIDVAFQAWLSDARGEFKPTT